MTQDPAATGTDPQDPHDARTDDPTPEPAVVDQERGDEDEAEVRANRPTGAEDVGA